MPRRFMTATLALCLALLSARWSPSARPSARTW